MAIKISKDISNKPWGDVDKSKIWARLKEGLQNGEAGVKDAIREMYAVTKAPIDENLTEADCFGPHHELNGDTLVLNRGGVIACYQAIKGARSEPDLTPEQKSKALSHIKRHYDELGLKMEGEMSIEAEVIGEMSTDEIPVSPNIKLDKLKEGDNEPLEVVVSIPVSKSKRGWQYTEQALQRIVDTVNKQGLPGGLGHQEADKVNYEFWNPVTHWVGAKFQNGVAYVRGVVDKSASDLKRWIKSGVIKNVSIFGIPTLKQASGETEVVDFTPLSIDWTPLGRNGMPTEIVAMGEIDNGGETILTKGEVLAQVKELNIPVGELLEVVGAKEYQEAVKVVGELREIYNANGLEIVEKIKEDRKLISELERTKREGVIDKIIGEMQTVAEVKGLVKKLIPETARTEDEIKKVVGEIMASEEVKAIVDKLYTDTKIKDGKADNQTALETVKVKI